jgi:hypothetical protein
VFDSFLTKCLCLTASWLSACVNYRGKFTLALAVSPDGILLASGAIDGIIAVFEVQVRASTFHLHTKRGRDSRYLGSMIRFVQTNHRFNIHSRFVVLVKLCPQLLFLFDKIHTTQLKHHFSFLVSKKAFSDNGPSYWLMLWYIIPKKRTSSTSKHEISSLFFIFAGFVLLHS